MADARIETRVMQADRRPSIRVVTLSDRDGEHLLAAPETFSDSAFADLVETISAGLRDEHIVLARIGGSAGASNAELEQVHIRTGRALGRLMAQNANGDEVVRVADRRPSDPEHARGFLSNTAMKLHTDGWDAAGLMCLRQAARGGESLFVSSRAVHHAIGEAGPDLLAVLYEIWLWDVRVLTGDPHRRPLRSSIFSACRGALSCRFGSYLLRNGAGDIHPALTPLQSEALDLFEATCAREDLQLRLPLRRGDAVWMNNRRVLHGRRAFADKAGAEGRLLSRLWVRLAAQPPLDPAFLAFDQECFGEHGGSASYS